ncbi:DNA-directed RNA polymerase II subunit RPB1 [Pycnococcus provasolii]
MPLRGVQNIKKVFLRQTKKVVNTVDGYHNEDEWMLDTEGVNMAEVMCDERIDFSRCLTNDLVETLQLFGIEATRAALLRELRGVIEFDGSYVNYRHLSILCDVMTCRGYLMAITRHGINRVENGPLMRCSFEETVDILFEASAHGMTDRMRGVSGPIMMGQLAPVGTGSFDLVLDEEKLERAMDMDGGAGGGGGGLLMKEQHPMTPSMMTPMHSSPFAVMSPGQQGGLFSPFAGGGGMSPSSQAMFSPFGGHQADGNAAIFSPSHSMMSPASFSPGGGGVSPGYSPTSPAYSPTQDSCFATLCFVCHARINATDSRKTPNPKPKTPNHFTGVLHSTDFAFILCLSARIKELTRANQNHLQLADFASASSLSRFLLLLPRENNTQLTISITFPLPQIFADFASASSLSRFLLLLPRENNTQLTISITFPLPQIFADFASASSLSRFLLLLPRENNTQLTISITFPYHRYSPTSPAQVHCLASCFSCLGRTTRN